MNHRSIPELLASDWAAGNKMLSQFRQTAYFPSLIRAYETLDREALYKSRFHGPDHIERVLLLGAIIAWKEALGEADTRLLLLACSYHDIGRVNEYRDNAHGARSAEKLQGSAFAETLAALADQEKRILCAAVEAHCLPGAMRTAIGEKYGIEAGEMERYQELAACLKDADNLDRVRLGDLDASRLRHESGKELVPFAEALYREYHT